MQTHAFHENPNVERILIGGGIQKIYLGGPNSVKLISTPSYYYETIVAIKIISLLYKDAVFVRTIV